MGIKLRHLPYVQLRGEVFRYRRPVPPPLMGIVGKREILISLQTRDPGEAELRFLEVHLSTERWFRSLVGGKAVSNSAEFYNLNQITSLDNLDSIIISQKSQAKLDDSFKISDCLKLYLKEKQAEYFQYKGRSRQTRINEKYRVIDYLISSIGEDKELSSIKREDARGYRSYLQSKGLKSASVQKNIQVCAAIIEMGLREKGINISNPFRRLSVAADVLAKEARLPLSSWEIAQMLKGSVNRELLLAQCNLPIFRKLEITDLTCFSRLSGLLA